MGKKLSIQETVKLVFMFAKDGVTYRFVAEEFKLNFSLKWASKQIQYALLVGRKSSLE